MGCIITATGNSGVLEGRLIGSILSKVENPTPLDFQKEVVYKAQCWLSYVGETGIRKYKRIQENPSEVARLMKLLLLLCEVGV